MLDLAEDKHSSLLAPAASDKEMFYNVDTSGQCYKQ